MDTQQDTRIDYRAAMAARSSLVGRIRMQIPKEPGKTTSDLSITNGLDEVDDVAATSGAPDWHVNVH